jgi:hypothetical protein
MIKEPLRIIISDGLDLSGHTTEHTLVRRFYSTLLEFHSNPDSMDMRIDDENTPGYSHIVSPFPL